MAGFALALSLLGISVPANGQGVQPRPQQGKTPDPELRGQWLRQGQTFACRVETKKGAAPPDPDLLSFACQRMGALGVGISEASLKAALGEPHRKLPPANNATNYVYFLGKADQSPYLAATVKANRVIALQVSGPAPAPGYSFNHINLGDSTEKTDGAVRRPLPCRAERAGEDRALDLSSMALLIRSAGGPRHVNPDQRSDRPVNRLYEALVTPVTGPGDP
ncbi:hypothetical protein [Bradyrhizobium canariense]|uniref:hypothetical protein n=1 Tax=Bradyrhizobium canariense TaxID=255045 RepID=UPI001FE5E106|nr:hypothetical protein [Bradyrhizobium canariense]